MYLASYPDYNLDSHDTEEEVELGFGQICKTEMFETPYAAAHYTALEGSLGGAVLSETGKVIGMHVENWYHETGYKATRNSLEFNLHKSEVGKRCISEDVTICYPCLRWDSGSRTSVVVQRLKADTLARYAAVNLPHKAGTSVFLPVKEIRHRLTTAQNILNREVLGIKDPID